MSRATPRMRDFAERLIVYETKRIKSSETKPPVAMLVVEKLRPQLENLMGKAGFRALLSRSLALASTDVQWLRAVHVKSDGFFEGSGELDAKVSRDDFFEGSVVLLAQLLGLLVAFVGEKLTLHLVREVWPKLPLNDLDFSE